MNEHRLRRIGWIEPSGTSTSWQYSVTGLARQCTILRESLVSTGELLLESRRCVRALTVLVMLLAFAGAWGWLR